MKTMKQIADEIGIPKQKVYRYVKANHIKMIHENETRFIFDEASEMLIKSHFSQKNESSSNQDESLKNSMLSIIETELEFRNEQIKIKDRLIKELTEQLKETTTALVLAQQMASTAQALHAGTIQTQLIDVSTDEKEEVPKGLFRRIFKRY